MIRGQTVPKARPKVMASIHNRFDIEVIDAKTGKLKQRAFAENVILDGLWNAFGERSWFNYVAYGSGTGTPSSSDTALFNWKGAQYISGGEADTSHITEGYISVTKYTSLSETTASGVTLREVGLSTGETKTSTLCTHAMLQDMNGNPVSIYKSSTDIITIYATVFFHWDPSGYNGVELFHSAVDNFLYPGSSLYYAYMYYGCGKGGFKDSYPGYTSATYDKSTRKFKTTFPRMAVGEGNIGGFRYVQVGSFIIEIPGPHRIVGESVGTGNGSKTGFYTDWDFPSNATVYVDGVPVEDVEVIEGLKSSSDFGRFLWAIDEKKSTPESLIYSSSALPTGSSDAGCGVGTFYNPYWEKYGILSFTTSWLDSVKVSNDLKSWVTVTSPVPEQYRNYKFWKATPSGTSYVTKNWRALYAYGTSPNIQFKTPPASGAVITIDYDTPMVPKDSNHVFDFSFEIQYGPYVAE